MGRRKGISPRRLEILKKATNAAALLKQKKTIAKKNNVIFANVDNLLQSLKNIQNDYCDHLTIGSSNFFKLIAKTLTPQCVHNSLIFSGTTNSGTFWENHFSNRNTFFTNEGDLIEYRIIVAQPFAKSDECSFISAKGDFVIEYSINGGRTNTALVEIKSTSSEKKFRAYQNGNTPEQFLQIQVALNCLKVSKAFLIVYFHKKRPSNNSSLNDIKLDNELLSELSDQSECNSEEDELEFETESENDLIFKSTVKEIAIDVTFFKKHQKNLTTGLLDYIGKAASFPNKPSQQVFDYCESKQKYVSTFFQNTKPNFRKKNRTFVSYVHFPPKKCYLITKMREHSRLKKATEPREVGRPRKFIGVKKNKLKKKFNMSKVSSARSLCDNKSLFAPSTFVSRKRLRKRKQ